MIGIDERAPFNSARRFANCYKFADADADQQKSRS